jgi:hypothetical protein
LQRDGRRRGFRFGGSGGNLLSAEKRFSGEGAYNIHFFLKQDLSIRRRTTLMIRLVL